MAALPDNPHAYSTKVEVIKGIKLSQYEFA
jgi:hypothetical protein